MTLPDKSMLCVPNIYREMLKSFNNIREHVIFQHSIENIYDQPLFYNPEILHCGKIIIWHDFIKAGIVQLKDICYEVKTGFLPNKAHNILVIHITFLQPSHTIVLLYII
jgi:hypothetical protein